MSRTTRACTHVLAWAACLALGAPLGRASAAERPSGRKIQAWQQSQNTFDVANQGEGGEQGYGTPDTVTGDGTISMDPAAAQKLRDLSRNPNMPQVFRQTLQNLSDQVTPSGLPALGQVKYGAPAGLGKAPLRPPRGPPRQDPRPMGIAGPRQDGVPEGTPVPLDLRNAGELQSGGAKAYVQPNAASGAPISPGGPGAGAGGAAPVWNRGAGFVQGNSPAAQNETEKTSKFISQAVSDLRAGTPEKALVSADKAVMLSPESAEARAVRAAVYERLRLDADKLRDLEAAAALDPARFQRVLEAAKGGHRLFEPSSTDSGQLLEAVLSPPTRALRRPPAFWLLPLAVLGALSLLLLSGLRWTRASYGPELARWSGVLRRWAKSFGRWQAPSVNDSSRPAPSAAEAAKPGSATPERPITHVGGPHTPAQRLRQDQVLAEKYRLVRSLGCDGTVEVWKGHDKTLDRAVLIKRIYAGVRSSDEGSRRHEEARSAAGLHHLNVVDMYEVLDLPTGLYVVYEYNPGKSLRHILQEKGKLSLVQVRDILIPVCKALEHAHHREIVHGGLSPERIHVTNQRYVQVSDFVLARTTGTGSEPYAAPEAKRGEPRTVSDIYSMGMCFFEMLTGELPNQSAYEPDPVIAPIIEKALDLDYRSRLSSAREFLALLQRLPDTYTIPEPRAEKPAAEAGPAESVEGNEPGNGAKGDSDPEPDTGRS